jgi:uncharacterized Zn-binding protein involved in type VI secretion
MMRAVICKGDPTSHGGKVIEGNETATFEGRPISNKGHMTYCPQCKGTFAIVEGVEFHSFVGAGTAVEDMKTACGAKLIATTTKGKMMLDHQARNAPADATSEQGQVADKPKKYRARFRAIDEVSRRPIAFLHYRIDLSDGSVLTGVADVDGYTKEAWTAGADQVEITWG